MSTYCIDRYSINSNGKQFVLKVGFIDNNILMEVIEENGIIQGGNIYSGEFSVESLKQISPVFQFSSNCVDAKQVIVRAIERNEIEIYEEIPNNINILFKMVLGSSQVPFILSIPKEKRKDYLGENIIIPSYQESKIIPTYPQSNIIPSYQESKVIPAIRQSNITPIYQELKVVPTFSESNLIPSFSESKNISMPESNIIPTFSESKSLPKYEETNIYQKETPFQIDNPAIIKDNTLYCNRVNDYTKSLDYFNENIRVNNNLTNYNNNFDYNVVSNKIQNSIGINNNMNSENNNFQQSFTFKDQSNIVDLASSQKIIDEKPNLEIQFETEIPKYKINDSSFYDNSEEIKNKVGCKYISYIKSKNDLSETSILRSKKFLEEEQNDNFSSGIEKNIISHPDNIINVTEKIEQILGGKIYYNLLYKASECGDEAAMFHNKCDYHERTLIIVKTTDGRRFGGYTSKSWEGENIKKKDEDAFVFSIDKNKTYDIIHDQFAIGCYPQFGPVFFGCQIRIYDKFFKKGGSTCLKCLNYQTLEDFELNGGQQKFRVKDLEVYEVNLL